MGIFYEILKKCNIYEPQPMSSSQYSFKNILIFLKKLINNFKISKIKNKQIIIIEHPRRLDERNDDIYTSFLYDIFYDKTLTIKHPLYGSIMPMDQNKYDCFYFESFLIKKKILKIIYSKKKISYFANKISKVINNEIDNNNDYYNFVEDLLLDKILSYKLARSFLDKYDLKCLIVVNGYGFNHFVLAAKQLGIKVIELQHGNIYDTHLGYHYPNSKSGSIKSFPDYILTFGEFWNNQAQFPIAKNYIIDNGFYFFEQNFINKKRNSISEKNKILIISQHNISKELKKLTEELAKKLIEYQFIFKPHPKENLNDLKYFGNNNDIKNISVSQKSLYELYPQVDYQIGVFSTGIYEGLGFGVKTIIYKINGWENVYSLIGNKGVVFIENSQQIIEIIRKKTIKDPEGNKFFSKNVFNNHKNFFKSLI